MDDSDIYSLWEDKDRAVPYNELLDAIARFLRQQLQETWDANTSLKHPWYLARNEGLRAWSEYEADLRLRPFYKERYTVSDFYELRLVEQMQDFGQAEVQDPYWSDFLVFKTQSEGVPFLNRILDKGKHKPAQHRPVHRHFCLYWDRFFIPFEFWTYAAMAECLVWVLKSKGAHVAGISENSLRQWGKRLKLQKSKHVIVLSFAEGEIKQRNEHAAVAVGLPEYSELRPWLPKDVTQFVRFM